MKKGSDSAMSKVRAAVFASGTGSNFEAIMEADIPCEIVLLVCNKEGAPVIEKAKNYGLDVLVIDASQYPNRVEFESVIVEKLKSSHVDWIFLAGYMRLISPTILDEYPDRILNIHPSFLPAYPGRDAIARALKDNAKETGVTVHLVDAGMDTGPIIAQTRVPIEADDTEETLSKRIHHVEHKLYPYVIRQVLEKFS